MEAFDDTKPLDRIKSRYTKTASVIARTIAFTSAFLFFISLCVAAYEVFMRYVFKHPHDWGDELSMITMIYGTFIGACLALREGKIISVDMVPQMLKPRPRTILQIVISITTIITCAVYAWSGSLVVHTFFIRGGHTSSSLQIPVWLIYLILPISLGLCTLVAIESLFKLISKPSAKTENT